jgi:bifunctional N-acetylglucosamine-1-phosphate-uridyltransferase/glucosamine-1-phosphate-acetyltransferase GlmU-like protein
MKCLAIIAAGNSKRMGGIPKALSFVDGIPNLENTIKKSHIFFDKIFVFCNSTHKEDFEHVIKNTEKKYGLDANKINLIVIVSGRGCGHAVLESMSQLISYRLSELYICWGDVFFENDDIFEELISKKIDRFPLIMPVVYENNPYVWMEHDNSKIICANFSKRGEITEAGLHDQSLFKIDFFRIFNALATMDSCLDKKGIYNNQNKEMIFLDVLCYLNNTKRPASLYETKHRTFGYNTETELDELNEYLKTND